MSEEFKIRLDKEDEGLDFDESEDEEVPESEEPLENLNEDDSW